MRSGEVSIAKLDISANGPITVDCEAATPGFEVSVWSLRSDDPGCITVALCVHRAQALPPEVSECVLRFRLGSSVAYALQTVRNVYESTYVG